MSRPHYLGRSYDGLASTSRENLTQYASGEDYPKSAYKEAYGSYPPANSPPMRGYNPAQQQRSNRRKWWIIGGIVLLLIIIGAVVGGILGTRHSGTTVRQSTGANAAVASGSSVTRDGNGNPVYPTTVSSAAGVAPTTVQNADLQCGSDPFTPGGNFQGASVPLRSGHPRLFAPAYQWQCLPKKIQNDQYLAAWNQSIFDNATTWYNNVTITYEFDGGPNGSGALDIARRLQQRIKAWAYAYRMTNDTRWVERAWTELYAMSGNDTGVYAGTPGDNWNSQHFLDVAEFTLAFAYAYDWMYDALTAARRTAIMYSIITLGLQKGLSQISANNFWLSATGNWNCICNGGLTAGALAILDEDPTGVAAQILEATLPNAQVGCAQGVGQDGTWQETSDYWYFGNQGAAQLASALITATGSDQGFLSANPSFNLSGYYHMTSMGFVEKFNWGDCGPNKFTATANALFLYGQHFNIPMYSLYQRDRSDAADPLSMFWYDPQVSGDWWNDLALDHQYTNTTDAWAMMRGSWTDSNQIYAAIKGGSPMNKQTHSNLDAGDFVFEALGQRWAGELCQDDYLEPNYFYPEGQSASRWLYYRCRTDGQNTITYNYASGASLNGNQLVTMEPSTTYGSTGEGQQSLAYVPSGTSAAYWVGDLTSAYGATIQRGMRLVNGRRQMLLQDEITSGAGASMWRMHTNATITMANNNKTASLALGGQTLQVLLQSPSSATFTQMSATRLASDPALPSGGSDLPNPGVSVLAINIPAGSQTVQVLFNPQWPNFSTFANPPGVPLAQWSTTSHN